MKTSQQYTELAYAGTSKLMDRDINYSLSRNV